MEDVTLYELNNLVRSVVEQTLDNEYWLQAELSEARLATNGHFYVEFVQKDESGRNLLARARGTIWARTYNMIAPLFERATGERLRAGMNVRVLVTIAFHELYGYSLNIVDIDPSYTLGDMAKRRREILEQLEADGIINDNKALSLPALLKRIAVISSQGAAGYGDFCDQLANNVYGLHYDVQLFPAVMQGVNVEESVLAALEAICAVAHPFDCVVIIRGGGATSELNSFDNYDLASYVANFPIPVIVGIGHERDVTVLDYVAALRVKTPTAAAETLIQRGTTALAHLDELQDAVVTAVRDTVSQAREHLAFFTTMIPAAARHLIDTNRIRLDNHARNIPFAAQGLIVNQRTRLERAVERLGDAVSRALQREQQRLVALGDKATLLSPVNTLQRGYSLVRLGDKCVTAADQLHSGDQITVQFAIGTTDATVN